MIPRKTGFGVARTRLQVSRTGTNGLPSASLRKHKKNELIPKNK